MSTTETTLRFVALGSRYSHAVRRANVTASAPLVESSSANLGMVIGTKEITELPLLLQPKLLRVLQDGTLRRVGGTELVTVNVRVVATSKVDLGFPQTR